MKNKFIKIFCSRVLITALLIIFQIVWLCILFNELAAYSTVINALFNILSVAMLLYIIGKDEKSGYKIGWIILIMLFPLFGGIFYFIFGNKRPAKKMRSRINAQHQRLNKFLPQKNAEIHKNPANRVQEKRISDTTEYLHNVSDYPLYSAQMSDCKYYPLGDDVFVDLVQALEKAERFIFMQYFIIDEGVMWNTMFDIMKRKAKQGVDVRLIYDDMGSLFLLPPEFAANVEKEGIKCFAFNRVVPFISLVMNNRDHRKITVIDGNIAFTGGFNLADEYINLRQPYGHWKDSGVQVRGEAVRSFTLMFLETWNAFRKDDSDMIIPKYMPTATADYDNLNLSASSNSVPPSENLNLSASADSVPSSENLNLSASTNSAPPSENLNLSASPDSVPTSENLNLSASPNNVPTSENLNLSASPNSVPHSENLNLSASPNSVPTSENLNLSALPDNVPTSENLNLSTSSDNVPQCEKMNTNECFLQPYADTPLDNEAVGECTYLEIINQAVDYVYIFTPYLICDSEMKLALRLAAKRGVDVRIVTPGIPDKKIVFRLTRSNYAYLLKSGVKIYEYTPGFIHSKSFVCDDRIAVIGTINLDYRSLFLHFECGLLAIDSPCIDQLKQDCLNTFAVSKEIGPTDVKHTVLGLLFDAILRVFAPLM